MFKIEAILGKAALVSDAPIFAGPEAGEQAVS